jgi:hypothetical protein
VLRIHWSIAMAEWSNEDVIELKNLLREGASLVEAARLLGRTVPE